jgi:hypothetical protein
MGEDIQSGCRVTTGERLVPKQPEPHRRCVSERISLGMVEMGGGANPVSEPRHHSPNECLTMSITRQGFANA